MDSHSLSSEAWRSPTRCLRAALSIRSQPGVTNNIVFDYSFPALLWSHAVRRSVSFVVNRVGRLIRVHVVHRSAMR